MSDTFNAIADVRGHPGQPVSLLYDGRVTLASDSAFPAIGVAATGAVVGHPQTVQVSGELKLQDWSQATGTAKLILGATYYLSAASGQLTTTATGQRIGEAISRTTLLIRIGSVGGVGGPHTHAIDDVTGLQPALDGKAATAHTHAIGDVTNLQSSLDGKADSSHTHTIANVTNLQSSLDGKAAISHGHAINDVTNLQSTLDGKAATGHTHAISEVTNLQASLDGKVAATREVNTQHSLTGGGDLSANRTLSLVNDAASPGGNKVYGTDGAGNKGWKSDPSGSPGSVNIKQTEIDFGPTPVSEGSFLITDADVSAGSQLIGSVAYEAPTGKDLDELEMDGLDLKFGPGSGQFTVYARGMDGYVADKFKLNYMIG